MPSGQSASTCGEEKEENNPVAAVSELYNMVIESHFPLATNIQSTDSQRGQKSDKSRF